MLFVYILCILRFIYILDLGSCLIAYKLIDRYFFPSDTMFKGPSFLHIVLWHLYLVVTLHMLQKSCQKCFSVMCSSDPHDECFVCLGTDHPIDCQLCSQLHQDGFRFRALMRIAWQMKGTLVKPVQVKQVLQEIDLPPEMAVFVNNVGHDLDSVRPFLSKAAIPDMDVRWNTVEDFSHKDESPSLDQEVEEISEDVPKAQKINNMILTIAKEKNLDISESKEQGEMFGLVAPKPKFSAALPLMPEFAKEMDKVRHFDKFYPSMMVKNCFRLPKADFANLLPNIKLDDILLDACDVRDGKLQNKALQQADNHFESLRQDLIAGVQTQQYACYGASYSLKLLSELRQNMMSNQIDWDQFEQAVSKVMDAAGLAVNASMEMANIVIRSHAAALRARRALWIESSRFNKAVKSAALKLPLPMGEEKDGVIKHSELFGSELKSLVDSRYHDLKYVEKVLSKQPQKRKAQKTGQRKDFKKPKWDLPAPLPRANRGRGRGGKSTQRNVSAKQDNKSQQKKSF